MLSTSFSMTTRRPRGHADLDAIPSPQPFDQVWGAAGDAETYMEELLKEYEEKMASPAFERNEAASLKVCTVEPWASCSPARQAELRARVARPDLLELDARLGSIYGALCRTVSSLPGNSEDKKSGTAMLKRLGHNMNSFVYSSVSQLRAEIPSHLTDVKATFDKVSYCLC